jgi:hypothetical protein
MLLPLVVGRCEEDVSIACGLYLLSEEGEEKKKILDS